MGTVPGVVPDPASFETTLDLNFHRLDIRWLRHLDNGTWTTAVTAGTDAVAVQDGAIDSRSQLLRARSTVFTKAWFWQDDVSLRLVLEILNTTLNSEMLTLNCQDDGEPCREEILGPVTLPNLGLVANF